MDSENEMEAVNIAKYSVNISLSKVCFCYASEAKLCEDGYSVTNLSASSSSRRISKSLVLRYSILGWEPDDILKKVNSIPGERINVLELSLLYLKLSSYDNPLRIESLFSSMTAIIRELYPKEIGNDFDPEYVSTRLLNKGIKELLRREENFDEIKFDKDWKQCYADERCAIAHGKKSIISDISRKYESDELIRKVYSWAAKLIVFYINSFCEPIRP